MSKRGRPALIRIEDQSPKFLREYRSDDGSSEIWYFDTDISKNGPIKVELKCKKIYRSLKSFEEEQAELPITKRVFFNEKSGKYVGYGRAKVLGILK